LMEKAFIVLLLYSMHNKTVDPPLCSQG
jgi:hypothetical protein